VSSVLYLGNVDFRDAGSDVAQISAGNLKHIARLLGVPEERLREKLLSSVTDSARGELLTRSHNVVKAKFARDSLAKSLCGVSCLSQMPGVLRSN
jgi:myosin heavy subunit